MIKILRREKIAVVRHGDGGHSLSRGQFRELLDFASSVEKAVIGVKVKMHKSRIRWHGYRHSILYAEVYLPGVQFGLGAVFQWRGHSWLRHASRVRKKP
jgi:hypothetical protein